jgi:general secretion pathway protein H
VKTGVGINHRYAGFTLLEILVVMVIASMMVALVPPMFSGAVAGAKIKGSARSLAIAMRETRSRAILQNTVQELRLNLKQHHYSAAGKNPEQLPADMRVGIEQITGARVEDQDEYALQFFPDGSSSGELITLQSGSRAYQLHLDWLTGSITIQEGQSGEG